MGITVEPAMNDVIGALQALSSILNHHSAVELSFLDFTKYMQ